MRSVFKLPIYTTAAACAALVLAGCGGGGGGGSTAQSGFNLVGRVFNAADGSPVSGASVQLDSRSATTDAGGVYRMDDISDSFAGGTLQVSANGFTTESTAVSVIGSALQVAPVGLTPVGTTVQMVPGTGGTVNQSVPEASTLPQVTLSVPPGALPGSTTVPVSVTPVVNQPAETFVTTASVKAQAVGDVASRRPEIELRISPSGQVLNSPATITMPLPFALPAGTAVPILQFKNSAWREVGTAIVDQSGAAATGTLSEFLPTGLECWHDFQFTSTTDPAMALQEASLSSIQNNINNLPDRHYVVNRTMSSNRADITARFRWTFSTPNLPTTPVNEEVLCLGPAGARDIMADYFASGEWNQAGGPVTFIVRNKTVTVRRLLDGQFLSNAGDFTATHGRPNWPRPVDHNQGGVQ